MPTRGHIEWEHEAGDVSATFRIEYAAWPGSPSTRDAPEEPAEVELEKVTCVGITSYDPLRRPQDREALVVMADLFSRLCDEDDSLREEIDDAIWEKLNEVDDGPE